MKFDLPLEQLREYRPQRREPEDFDAFWRSSLDEASRHPLEPKFEALDCGLVTVDSFDLTFAGFGGQPIKGWFMLPKLPKKDTLPCVVEFIGYGGGRGFPVDWLVWPSTGYAYLVMDTRGQGSGWMPGDTPDLSPGGTGPSTGAFLTQGLLDPSSYYYRRVFVDAVRAIEAAASHPAVDPLRIAASGSSQGGGIAIAVGGLSDRPAALMADVPFLSQCRRALEITDAEPYSELTKYLKVHRDQTEAVFHTLSYFDGVNFAVRAQARALFSVALMDVICPPSTVFAAYNHYAGPKDIRIYEYNNHEGGQSFHTLEKIRYLKDLWG